MSKRLEERPLMDIIDPKILQTPADLVALQQVFKLVLSCLDPEEIFRPPIFEVCFRLSNIGVIFNLQSKAEQRGPKGSDEASFHLLHYPLFSRKLTRELKEYTDSFHRDYLNSSLKNIEPHVTSHDGHSESLEAQKSKQFEADSEQETGQVPEMLDAKQDQILSLNTNSIPANSFNSTSKIICIILD